MFDTLSEQTPTKSLWFLAVSSSISQFSITTTAIQLTTTLDFILLQPLPFPYPLYLLYLLPQFPNFFNYITMPNKINDSNSTLASTGSNDQVIVPNMQGTLVPSIQQHTSPSMLTRISRSQCRPSSNNTSPRHHSQPGWSDLRRDKNIRLGQATLEVNNFPSTFDSGPTKSLSPSIYTHTQQQTIPLAGMHAAVAG